MGPWHLRKRDQPLDLALNGSILKCLQKSRASVKECKVKEVLKNRGWISLLSNKGRDRGEGEREGKIPYRNVLIPCKCL